MLNGRSRSTVEKVAELIRHDAMQLEDGALLGSEDTLLEKYQVSRPTLRQAAGLVTQEQLLNVRRGVGGGYFVRRPDSRAVSHIAAIYLKVHDAKLSEIIAAFMPIRIELARLATQCKDKALHAKMKAFLDHENEINDDPHLRDFIIGERKFNAILGQMSGNKALTLFLETLLDLSAMVDREEDMYRNRPDRVEMRRQERNRLAAAVVERDEEMAALAARRGAQMASGWLTEDMRERKQTITFEPLHRNDDLRDL